MSDARADRNRQNAMAFYDLMFNQNRPAEAIAQYVGAHYTQNKPEVADGKEAFIAYFERMAREYPGKHVSFKRTTRPTITRCSRIERRVC